MRAGTRGIGARLWLGYGAALALMLAVAGLSLDRLALVQRQADQVVNIHVAALDAIGRLQDLSTQRAVLLRDLIINDNLQQQREGMARLRENEHEYAAAVGRFATVPGAAAALAVVAQAATLEKHAVELLGEARFDEAKQFLAATLNPRHEALRGELRRIFVSTMEAADRSVEDNRRSFRVVMTLVAAAVAIALALGAGIAFLVTRSITRPLAQAKGLAMRVQEGDLAQRLEARGSDEIGQLIATLEAMRAALERQVSAIRHAADRVGGASERIVSGNHDLAERNTEQAAGLEETAAAMQQLTTTVKRNTDSARQASELAHGSSEVAQRGGEAVRRVTDTMRGILQSSREIADIVAVIDSIAFQTNILALNAAVEAARAGEQGRGFAVVAAEVRSLAQRSSEAAHQIRQLIAASSERIDGGAHQVEAAGATMAEIVEFAGRVAQLVADIAAASREQLAGIEQVNGALVRMEDHTERNARLVDDSVAQARGAAREAQELISLMARFRVRGDVVSEPALQVLPPEIAEPRGR